MVDASLDLQDVEGVAIGTVEREPSAQCILCKGCCTQNSLVETASKILPSLDTESWLST